jgi:hypothetical protein
MADAYDGLVKTGAIGSLKRDILLGAADDIYYLAHVRRWFGTASAEAAKTAPPAQFASSENSLRRTFVALRGGEKRRDHLK